MDIFTGSTLTIHQACQVLPRGRNNSRPHFATVLSWIKRGRKAPDGTLVKLKALYISSKWVTTREDLVRFFERLTPSAEQTPLPISSPSARNKAAEQAAKEVDEKGI